LTFSDLVAPKGAIFDSKHKPCSLKAIEFFLVITLTKFVSPLFLRELIIVHMSVFVSIFFILDGSFFFPQNVAFCATSGV